MLVAPCQDIQPGKVPAYSFVPILMVPLPVVSVWLS